MRNRYKRCSDWRPCPNATDEIWWKPSPFAIEIADARDGQNNQIHINGAMRVVVAATGKPAKVGMGGTVPFIGEMAWQDAVRLASDLTSELRYVR